MDSPKWKKTLKHLLVSVGRVAGISKNVALGASLLTLWSAHPSAASPRVPVNEVAVTSIPTTEIKKYSAKYLLKSAASSRFVTRLVQRHRSHSSHSSHSSHASHYSSSGGTAPSRTPPSSSAPTTPSPAPRTESRVTPAFGFRDDFGGIVRISSRWSVGAPTNEGASIDPLVGVSQKNGRLEIAPLAGVNGKHYNGYFSTSTWNLTDAQATVEIVQAPATKASMTFALAMDSDNWYGFVIENGTLYFQSKVKGVKSPKSTPYNASQHRFWRLRHDPATRLLLWETSPDKDTWTIRNAESPQVPLTNLYVTLSAGSYRAVSQPGTAAFANFQLTRNP